MEEVLPFWVLGLVFKRTGNFHLGLLEPELPSKKKSDPSSGHTSWAGSASYTEKGRCPAESSLLVLADVQTWE